MVFEKLRQANMTVNLEKSNFIQKESAPSGVFRSHRKLNTYAHSLDFANFYRKFCARYSAATQDLNKLLRKGEKWKWGRNEQNNFTKISADKAKCDICSVTLSIKGGSTTNLIRHTKTKHPTVNIDNLNKRIPRKTNSPSLTKGDADDANCETAVPSTSASTTASVGTRSVTIWPISSVKTNNFVGKQSCITQFTSRPIYIGDQE
ncbi:hypothetical protein MTP99_002885 [Tenebrio molitor]|nr:hypothetical protein MTP99_002885 [Tenebrio molitor]